MPPFSGQPEPALHAAAPGESSAPKPRATSPCCAEAILTNRNIEETIAKIANFLTRNLLSIFFPWRQTDPPTRLDASVCVTPNHKLQMGTGSNWWPAGTENLGPLPSRHRAHF